MPQNNSMPLTSLNGGQTLIYGQIIAYSYINKYIITEVNRRCVLKSRCCCILNYKSTFYIVIQLIFIYFFPLLFYFKKFINSNICIFIYYCNIIHLLYIYNTLKSYFAIIWNDRVQNKCWLSVIKNNIDKLMLN